MTPKNDIYNYKHKLDMAKKKLEKADISDKNRELIEQFDRACFMEGLSKPRRLKLIGTLIILAEKYLRSDFDAATKEDIKDIVIKIDSREDCSPWTKHSYKVIIKKFYKWLKFGDEYRMVNEYPPVVSWLRCNLKKKEQPRIKASDILTEEEVKKLIDVAEHSRDKAFISMLYELGARIGEIGSLRIKEVTRDKYGYIVDLEGKTGHRTPRIVISDPHITQWLNTHPLRDKPESPLWIRIGHRVKEDKMTYGAFRELLLRLVARAGIKRRVYHHLFRHTRVTHLLINKQINEAQAKVYFGWVPDSKMLSEYSHLISSDVNDAILAMHGIKTDKFKESPLKPRQCIRCSVINSRDAKFCHKCGSVLDVNTALDLDERRNQVDGIMTQLVKDPEVLQIILRKMAQMGLEDKFLKVTGKA
ncbi:tyrosine-type recombinase/integrase [Candidatus Poribacteria bacterium]|nr:tyrosine-type recombinase/integrase [Candidatus Poribacteria bacterium]